MTLSITGLDRTANSCTVFQTTETLCLDGAPNNANDAPTPGMTGLTGNIASGCTDDVEVQFIWEPSVAHSWSHNTTPHAGSSLPLIRCQRRGSGRQGPIQVCKDEKIRMMESKIYRALGKVNHGS